MNDYRELAAEVERKASEDFAQANPQPKNSSDRTGERAAYRVAENRFIREAVEKWFLASDLHSSIVIRRDKSVEISDAYYGSSITVYPPQREYEYHEEDDKRKFSVKPAYMNCSTWSTGIASVEHVQRRTLQYLKMVEIAVDVQNEMNQSLSDWPNMVNPFEQARWEHDELQRYKANEKREIEKALEKQKAKEAKKVAAR